MKQEVQVLGTHPKQKDVDAEPCFLPLFALFGLYKAWKQFGATRNSPQNMNFGQGTGMQGFYGNWPMQGTGIPGLGGMNNPHSSPRQRGIMSFWPFLF